MKPIFVSALFLIFISAVLGQAVEPLSYSERWAISDHKESLLEELSPHTDEYYYYHAIHQLHEGQINLLTTLLSEWKKSPSTNSTYRNSIHSIDLQRLALIAQAPEHSRKEEAYKRLGIKLDHPAPIHPTDSSIPSTIDPKLLSEEHLTSSWNTMQRIQATDGNKLNSLLSNKLKPQELSAILAKISIPTHPELVSFVQRDLLQPNVDFGQYKIHSLLTTDQLEQLTNLDPSIRQNTQWISTMLQRIQPTPEEYETWSYAQKREQAKSLVTFTQTLASAFQHLKRNALAQKLHLDLASQDAKLSDYIAYLKLSPQTIRIQQSKISRQRIQWGQAMPPVNHLDTRMHQTRLAEYFLQKDENLENLRPFFKEKEFIRLQARAHLLSGDIQDQWKQALTPEELEEIKQSYELEIRETTPTHWNTQDTPFLDLSLKNSPSVVVSTYNLDLRSYIQLNQDLPDLTLETASLTPHKQETIHFENGPFERFEHRLNFPQLSSHGDWLIKVEANGLSSAALIHKGDIHTLSTVTPDGHLLHFLDEAHNPIPKLEVQLGKQKLITQGGKLLVPFTPYPTEQTLVLSRIRENNTLGRTSFHTLENAPAQYQLSIGHLSHKEQLCAQKTVTIYARPKLQIGDSPCSLSLLSSPSIELVATLNSGEALSLYRATPQLSDNEFIPIEFVVPEQLNRLTIHFSADTPSTGSMTKRKEATTFIDAYLGSNLIGHIYTQLQENQHVIFALGKNGEPLPNLPLQIQLRHRNYKSLLTSIQLKTDLQGKATLGDLHQFHSFSIEKTALTSRFHHSINHNYTKLPKVAHFKKGENPQFIYSVNNQQETKFHLFQANMQNEYIHDISDSLNVSKEGQNLRVQLNGLDTGIYTLLSNQGDHCRVHIMQQKIIDTKWMTDQGSAHTVRYSTPPSIHTTKLVNGSLKIALDKHTPNTRIHLIASQFIDNDTLKGLVPRNQPTNKIIHFAPSVSDWNNGGFLSSEQQYIQRRRLEGHRLGNMLPRPSLLLQPWEIDLSSATAHTSSGGTRMKSRKRGSDPFAIGGGDTVSFFEGESSNSFHCSLQHPAKILTDLQPNASGKVSIPLGNWNDFSNFEVILTDIDHINSQKLAKPDQTVAKEDRRFESQLPLNKHFIPRQEVKVLQKDSPIHLNANLEQKWTTFTSRADVIHYLKAQTHKGGRMQLADYFYQWDFLPESTHLKVLSEEGSHELHLFLKLHHKKWFEAIVRPILQNKRHRSFFDLYLLDQDLSEYLTPWRFQKLNAAEKALLAHAIPNAKKQIVRALTHEKEQIKSSKQSLSYHFPSLINFTPENHTQLSEKALKISQLLNDTILEKIEIVDTESFYATLQKASDAIGYPIQLPEAFQLAKNFTLQLDQSTVLELLENIVEANGLRVSITDDSVQLLAIRGSSKDALETKIFIIPENFSRLLSGSHAITKQPSIQQLLEEAGVSFPLGSSASIANNQLRVKNTSINLSIIAQILDQTNSSPPLSHDDSADPFAIEAVDESAGIMVRNPAQAHKIPQLAKEEMSTAYDDSNTKKWAESYYYRTSRTIPLAIESNQFWIDVAKAPTLASFLSPNFYYCSELENEALLASAILSLPSTPQSLKTSQSDGKIKLSSSKPCLVVFEDMIETESHKDGSIAATLQFFHTITPSKDPFAITKKPQEIVKAFQRSQSYTMSVKLSNLSSESREVSLFASLPDGTIATSTALSANETIRLPAYGNQEIGVNFYFPEAGEFTIYPPHVSENGKLLLALDSQTLNVAESIDTTDSTSWSNLASYGTSEQVLKRLTEENLTQQQLRQITWRLKDETFYKKASKLLRNSLLYPKDLLAYSFLHNDTPTQKQWVQQYFASQENEPDALPGSVDLFSLQQRQPLEWSPLIIERAHKLEDQDRLNHPSAKEYYTTLLADLSWKQKPSNEDLLDIIYCLYLQGRLDEASDLLAQIKNLPSQCQTQLSYLQCYDAFQKENILQAKTIATKALESPLTNKWKQYFQTVLDQAKQIESQTIQLTEALSENDTADQTIRLTSTGHDLHLQHGSVESTILHVYDIDLEVLFSEDPFYSKELGGYQAIQPTNTLEVTLNSKERKTLYPLPEALHSKNLLITLATGVAGNEKVVIDSSTIDARISAREGILQAIQVQENKTLPRTYVKVYAKLQNGQIEFFKDGYTDLRGKFRYSTNNRIKLNEVKEFAILMHHPDQGGKRILIKN